MNRCLRAEGKTHQGVSIQLAKASRVLLAQALDSRLKDSPMHTRVRGLSSNTLVNQFNKFKRHETIADNLTKNVALGWGPFPDGPTYHV
jgi:hypothetical protein